MQKKKKENNIFPTTIYHSVIYFYARKEKETEEKKNICSASFIAFGCLCRLSVNFNLLCRHRAKLCSTEDRT